MHKHCRVLVTGAGSGVGQGIIKSLRMSTLPLTIISADIKQMNSALYRTDEAIIIPRVEQKGALIEMIELLKINRIDVVMIGSEFDLNFFSENRAEIERLSHTIVIVAPLETVLIANDKWLTAEFLRKHNLAYAEAALPKDLRDAINIAKTWGYPVMLKARTGTSSRHVHIIDNEDTLKNYYPLIPMPMLQRVINTPLSELHEEYTCSVFKSCEGEILGPFTARRTIRGGTSWHVEVSHFKELEPLLLSIAKVMDFIGSLNIQLMLAEHGPVPFEINSRFSGTTAVRAHYGFNEPEMALISYFYHEKIDTPIIKSGIALRYHEEVFIDDVNADSLQAGTHKGYVNSWF